MIQDGNKQYYPAYDGNGNVTGLMDGNGNASAKYEYSPFGELLRCEGAYARQNPFQWSSKWTDKETSLVYYGLRYYSPHTGKFINCDPIGERGGLNLYRFIANNPINLVDILGMYIRSGFRQEGNCLVLFHVWIDDGQEIEKEYDRRCYEGGLADVVLMERFRVTPNDPSYRFFPDGLVPFDYFLDVEQYRKEAIDDWDTASSESSDPTESKCEQLTRQLLAQYNKLDKAGERLDKAKKTELAYKEKFFDRGFDYGRTFAIDAGGVALSIATAGSSRVVVHGVATVGQVGLDVASAVFSGLDGDRTGVALAGSSELTTMASYDVIEKGVNAPRAVKTLARFANGVTGASIVYNFGNYVTDNNVNKMAYWSAMGESRSAQERYDTLKKNIDETTRLMDVHNCKTNKD